MTRVTLLYFASLRDAAGVASEVVDSEAADLRALYRQAQVRHGFALPVERLRAAIGDRFVSWDSPLPADAEIAFIPPVSGG